MRKLIDPLSRLWGIFFPLRYAIRKGKVILRGERIRFYRGSVISGSVFEGYNALRRGVRFSQSELGEGSYINERSEIIGARIGRYCSIGEGVKIGFGSHPMGSRVSTSGLFLMDTTPFLGFTLHRGTPLGACYKRTSDGYLAEIGNDVWIGSGAKILDGIIIGDGAVVGAGAVVTKAVEPYTVVAGVPARPLRKRFNEEQIRFLLQFRWWDKGIGWVKAHYRELDDIELLLKKYKINE